MRGALIALAVVRAFIGPAHAAPLEACELQLAERMGQGINSTEPGAELYACEHGVTIQAARVIVAKQAGALKDFYKRTEDAKERLCGTEGYICGTLEPLY